ncbi:pyridoxal phosphate-dependent aminotransferase [Candidatus Nomurabacteria bacterium]|nr:pyridoxal phosphate-dependent aminotransferase [Candidatus Nomurabacteria bacterium]
MKYRLTKFANSIDGQPMFKVLAKVQEMQRQGKDIVHFEIGDPDFDTPKNIVEAAKEALDAGKTHYAPSIGVKELRESIQRATERSRGFKPDLDQILVVPGANMGIYYAVSCLVEPGDEVIVPDPGFPTYYSVIKACGVKAVRVPLREENSFRMNPEDVRKAITDKTRLIILNSPQNPTGSVMTKEEIEEIAQIAKDHDIYIYSDEIYSRMYYAEGVSFRSPSFLDECKERTIVANGFSKAFAMTGWRIGALVGPADVIAKMELLLQTTSSCVPPFIQYAAIEAVEGDQSAVKMMVGEYKERMQTLVDGLNDIKGIKCLAPGGAIYIFPNISGTGMTSAEFADFALEKAGVAVLPGTNFGEYGEGYIRMCVVSSRADIEKGVKRLKEAIEAR